MCIAEEAELREDWDPMLARLKRVTLIGAPWRDVRPTDLLQALMIVFGNLAFIAGTDYLVSTLI